VIKPHIFRSKTRPGYFVCVGVNNFAYGRSAATAWLAWARKVVP